MGKKYRKYKNTMEKFLSSDNGRRFFHVAYSVGAAIVLLGVLFKLNHYPFGSTVLFIGLGTEILIFLISAFDHPTKEYHWEEVFPVLETNETADRPNFSGNSFNETVIPKQTRITTTETVSMSGEIPVEQLASVSENVRKFAQATETLSKISETLSESYNYFSGNAQNSAQNASGFVQQMETLNRNVAGLNTIYEIQLKSISGQIDTIEHINSGLNRIKNMYDDAVPDSGVFRRETEKMTQQLQELNQVYARLLEAMTRKNS